MRNSSSIYVLCVVALFAATAGCAQQHVVVPGQQADGSAADVRAAGTSAAIPLPRRPDWPATPATTVFLDLDPAGPTADDAAKLLSDALGDRAATPPVAMLAERRLGLALTVSRADGVALANRALEETGLFARVSAPKIDLAIEGLPNPIKNAFAAAAKADGKRLIVFKFEAGWCGPCQAIKTQTLVQPDVKALIAERFYLKSIDIDYEPGSAQLLGVGPIPDIRVYDLDGNELARNIGAIGADAMIAMLQDAQKAAGE